MVLHLGEMSNQEMADWFGTSLKNFYNKKAKKLEELKYFADFHEERGKVIIDAIRFDTYQKQARKTYEQIKQKIDETWAEDGLDTCVHVGDKIYQELTSNNTLNLKKNTVTEYTRQGRNELYGRPFEAPGILGHCEYVWCKKLSDGNYERFNDEELALKKLYIEKYFGNVEDKLLFARQMVMNGEISKEDYFDFEGSITGFDDADRFKNFLDDFSAAIGAHVVHATLVYRDNTNPELPGTFS